MNPPSSTQLRLDQLKRILQDDLEPKQLEELGAALIGNLCGVSVAVAKSGFQHGGDAGPAGRQNRTFRIETKRYADNTPLSDRELLGEIDHALRRDSAMEAWILIATRAAPEQLEQDLLHKSNEIGVPIVVIDWKAGAFPALAALCSSAPDLLDSHATPAAAQLARELAPESQAALASLKRDLESWNLGFHNLRRLSHLRLTDIWSSPPTSMAKLGQDAAGRHQGRTLIRRQKSFDALSTWWAGKASTNAPAAVIGSEGVGKTWAVLDWLNDQLSDLPIILALPSSTFAGLPGTSTATVKRFLGERLSELVGVRDALHWQARLDRLLHRPDSEGPVLTLLLDGLNQEPSAAWLDLLRTLQDAPFASRVRVILTTRHLHFTEKLSSLRGLVASAISIPVDVYDDAPGGELDQRLAAEELTRRDLHSDLIPLARTPRLFSLVVRFRERLVDAGQVTVHRLLWEYGRDSFGARAGKSFSEDEWRSWLQEMARRHLAGKRDYSYAELGDTTAAPDLAPPDVFRRLSDIVDTRFATRNASGRFELNPTLVTHALASAMLATLDDLDNKDEGIVETTVANWFDPFNGLDEKPEILRAAVSILVERGGATPPAITSTLVTEWLLSQNVPDEHRTELAHLAFPLADALLDVIWRSGDYTRRSASYWAVNALRAIPRTDTLYLDKLVGRFSDWLRVISRDADPPNRENEEAERARSRRLQTRVGFDADGERVVLGRKLLFVDKFHNLANMAVPSLLEGFPLATVLPAFELAALGLAIRGRQEHWDGLKWLCLLNTTDFTATSSALRRSAEHFAGLSPEPGVHPELPARVGALLLWMSGDEDDEARATIMNPGLDQHLSYDEYEADPGNSFFPLERRHAEQVLADTTIPLIRRIQRGKEFITDPTFQPPQIFCQEVAAVAETFDVSTLDTSRNVTSQDHNLETLLPTLARCTPQALAELLHRKVAGFPTRPAAQRYICAMQATKHLLLTTASDAEAARALRLAHRESDANQEAFPAARLLMMEFLGLTSLERVERTIEAGLAHIPSILADMIGPLSDSDAQTLTDRYRSGSAEQVDDLVMLLSATVTTLTEQSWQWIYGLSQNDVYKHRGLTFQILNAADSQRFGRDLASSGWSWAPTQDPLCNHYGSLAFIAGTIGTPFEQIITSIAPWLILRATIARGGSATDSQLAAAVLGDLLRAPGTGPEGLGSDLTIDSERRRQYPFSLLLAPRDNDDDPFAALKDPDGHHERRIAAVNKSLERIREAQSAGAKLYLHHITADEFGALIEHAPMEVIRWTEGADEVTPEFTRQVRLAEGVFLALCEALLQRSPQRGEILWRGLRKVVLTRFRGSAHVDEMTHMLFRVPTTPHALREEHLSLRQTHSDKALLDLAIAAHSNNATDWLNKVISDDADSGVAWRIRRGRILAGFSTGNSLPVLDAWHQGRPDNRTARIITAAKFRHTEASARHWWNEYRNAESDADAYAAWILFLNTADHRAYECIAPSVRAEPLDPRRLAHLHANEEVLESAIKEREKSLGKNFLGQRIVDDFGPWRTASG